jgi:hypothetical protein
MTLTDKAKFLIELTMALLTITYTNLRKIKDEIVDCTPEEHEALDRLSRLADELDDRVSGVLQSIRRRKWKGEEEWK